MGLHTQRVGIVADLNDLILGEDGPVQSVLQSNDLSWRARKCQQVFTAAYMEKYSHMDIRSKNNVLLDFLQCQVVFCGKICQVSELFLKCETNVLFVGAIGTRWAPEWNAAPPASYLRNINPGSFVGQGGPQT